MTKRFSCVHFIREIRAELGGVVSAVLDMCQSTAARGHRVVVVTCNAKGAPPSWRAASDDLPHVVEVPASSLTSRLLGRQALDSFQHIVANVDVAHLHTPWELSNFQLSRILREVSVPYVVTVHGMLDDWVMQQKSLKKRTFLTFGGRRLFERATTIHFTAQAEMEQALRRVPGADRAVVHALAIDLSSFNTLPGAEPALKAFPQIRPDARKILFLSRVHPKKGIDLLIRAAAMVRRQSPAVDFQVLIAGPGDETYVASLKKLAAELNVSDVALFLGMVQGVEKRSLYQGADVFVLPTHQENFGLVLAEAMACGTPVVTTRGTDIWHELQEGGAKIVAHSPEEIASAILAVLADPNESRRIGAKGRQFVYHWLDTDRIAAAYEQMYFDAIARGVPPFSPQVPRPEHDKLAVG